MIEALEEYATGALSVAQIYEAGDHTVWERLRTQERARYWAEFHTAQAASHEREGNMDIAADHVAQAEEFRLMSKGEAR